MRPAPNWQKLNMSGSSAIVCRRRYDTDPLVLPMKLASLHVSISTRRKLASIMLAVAIFAFLAGLTSFATRGAIIYAIIDSILVGTGVGLFEQFYVQSLRGRWLRSMHPLLSISIYTAVVVVLFVVAVHLSHLATGQWDTLPRAYRRFPFALPLVIAFSVIGIVVMRTVHFIGIDTLFHLMIGTYHRPVLEEKVLLFLDINNSTGLAEHLGAIQIKSLVGKFLFDISKPITDYGGEIYLYKGDGLIALWNWHEAILGNRILRAIDAVFASVRREEAAYRRQFGVVPRFRVGVHGGEVVVSEQGDTKRAIGIYGSTINIAARMEEAAKAHSVACAVSGDVAQALAGDEPRLLPLGDQQVKGISVEIPIFEYRVDDAAETGTPGSASPRLRMPQPA
jgi:class 3 adenylate cyclase